MQTFITQTVTTSAASRVGQFDYDAMTKVGYLYLSDDRTSIVTTKRIQDGVLVDYDRFGRVVGIEFLDMDASPEIVSVT